MNAVLAVAAKEFRDGLRNRWVLSITVIFALLAVGLAWFGPAASGTVGFAPLATTIVSLASLAVFLIPLIALMLGYDTVVGEAEKGTLLLLLAYPVSRLQLLGGKFLGHGAILAVSTAIGFGAAGLLIAALTHQLASPTLWGEFGFFILTAILLGWVFAAIACLISVSVAEKAKAAGVALVVWFAAVIIFDLGLLGFLVATRGAVGEAGRLVLPYLLLLNPTDVFRVANLIGFAPARTYAGLATVVAGDTLSPATLVAALAVWAAGVFGLAAWRFQRREA